MMHNLLELLVTVGCILALEVIIVVMVVSRVSDKNFRNLIGRLIRWICKLRDWSNDCSDDCQYFFSMALDKPMSEEMATEMATRCFIAKGLLDEKYNEFFQMYIGLLQGTLSSKEESRLRAWARMVQAEDILNLASLSQLTQEEVG